MLDNNLHYLTNYRTIEYRIYVESARDRRSIIYKNTAKQKRGFIVSRFPQIFFRIPKFPHDLVIHISLRTACPKRKMDEFSKRNL